MNFYTCIIGTELLNGRRHDEHFAFVNSELLKRGWEQKASFVIKDEPEFIASVFEFIKNDPKSVMFSFGGIGATPDDYTRAVAAKVFTNGDIERHPEALRLIEDKFKEQAYPNRVKMADLPAGAGLLQNVVNQVPGFSIENRFFFVPGFPSMAKDMVLEALNNFYPKNRDKYSKTFTAYCSEGRLIEAMQKLPPILEFSSLPIIDGDKRAVELLVASFDEDFTKEWYCFLIDEIEKKDITWRDGGYYEDLVTAL